MGKSKKHLSLMERASEYFDLPGELVGMPRITVTGSQRVLIENHKGLIEYGTNEMAVNGGKMIIKIRGTELDIRSMNSYELTISGIISSVDFDIIDMR